MNKTRWKEGVLESRVSAYKCYTYFRIPFSLMEFLTSISQQFKEMMYAAVVAHLSVGSDNVFEGVAFSCQFNRLSHMRHITRTFDITLFL